MSRDDEAPSLARLPEEGARRPDQAHGFEMTLRPLTQPVERAGRM